MRVFLDRELQLASDFFDILQKELTPRIISHNITETDISITIESFSLNITPNLTDHNKVNVTTMHNNALLESFDEIDFPDGLVRSRYESVKFFYPEQF